MKVDGRCHCGFLSYVAEVDPEQVEICHCTDCQTLSGSAFRVVVPAEPRTPAGARAEAPVAVVQSTFE